MEDTLAPIEIALRVLKAINHRRQPDPADVESLYYLAPLLSDVPVDELACDVIQQALQHREFTCRVAAFSR